MKYRCENGHVIKRSKGQTHTKCGFCQEIVGISPLPPEQQHNQLEKDSTGKCYGPAYRNKRQRRRERLFRVSTISGKR